MKGIIFDAESIHGIQDGRKTMTRRVMNPQPVYKDGIWELGGAGWSDRIKRIVPVYGHSLYYRATYRPGDSMWVKERHRVGAWDIQAQKMAFDYEDGTCGPLIHIPNRDMFDRFVEQSRNDARKAGCHYNGADFVWEKGKAPTRWRRAVYMPFAAARIFLRVTDVRAERVQDIARQDAIAEGCHGVCIDGYYYRVTPEWEYEMRWDDINGKRGPKGDRGRFSWARNPWVWVYTFKRISKKEALKGAA